MEEIGTAPAVTPSQTNTHKKVRSVFNQQIDKVGLSCMHTEIDGGDSYDSFCIVKKRWDREAKKEKEMKLWLSQSELSILVTLYERCMEEIASRDVEQSS